MSEWHPLLPADLDDLNRLAALVHPTLPERPEVFAEKLRLFPQGCRKLLGGTRLVGYGLSHPWSLNAIPPLDEFLHRLPSKPQCLYIHDLVVRPEARGQHAAGEYLAYVKAVARQRGLAALALVSVYGADRLWRRYGFEVVRDPVVAVEAQSYGDSAKYMVGETLL